MLRGMAWRRRLYGSEDLAGGTVWLVEDVERWITEHQPWKARGADEPPPPES
ncbi:hypothetical protein ACQPZK_13115 [Micromonospora sp. CA-249363]|uniref:hypothetical protein n=1 Tax=Micromonospora sp. CA-249363 TaxID=3239963 RepID=UPI003D90F9DD